MVFNRILNKCQQQWKDMCWWYQAQWYENVPRVVCDQGVCLQNQKLSVFGIVFYLFLSKPVLNSR